DPALPRGESAPRRAAGPAADGRADVLGPRPGLVLDLAGPSLPRRRPDHLRQLTALALGRHDRRLHRPPDPAVLAGRPDAPDVRRGAVVARALRARLPVPRPGARDRRLAE